jgi:hypothetical protein
MSERALRKPSFWERFGAPFAPMHAEKQVGETRRSSLTRGGWNAHPQAVENRKIRNLPVGAASVLFWAGKGLAKTGNYLG